MGNWNSCYRVWASVTLWYTLDFSLDFQFTHPNKTKIHIIDFTSFWNFDLLWISIYLFGISTYLLGFHFTFFRFSIYFFENVPVWNFHLPFSGIPIFFGISIYLGFQFTFFRFTIYILGISIYLSGIPVEFQPLWNFDLHLGFQFTC